ncbi:MAG: M61 family metallopeptidase [Planctomycetales bacterium]|nr:M61 family metallopeptidase [Planctomycetales bacterium]
MYNPPTSQPNSLHYRVDFSEPNHHVVDVQLWIPQGSSNNMTLVFPVWTPGSYMVREYTRNIEAISARTVSPSQELSSRPLALQREGKNRWRVVDGLTEQSLDSLNWILVEYRLYCREMSVRTNWVEGNFGFLTGAATFPWIEGRQNEPITLELKLATDWSDVATSLPESSTQTRQVRVYEAATYDELVDSPVVCGNFPIARFQVNSHVHYLANVGAANLWDVDRAVDDIAKIIQTEHEFWGEIPYQQYWILNLNTECGGGLEHDNSTVLMCSRWTMRKRDAYVNWLALVSHEFFHTWNVRRLRPRSLLEYDYEKEQFIRELWIAEGITSYFDDLFLIRSDVCTREEYLGRLTKNLQSVQNAPGRLVQDLESASWDAWVKHYRPDENTHNARISYYLKGAIVAWLLDVQLRRATNDAVWLDHVMRRLWQQYLATGYTLEDFSTLVSELGGVELESWLNQQITQAGELDIQPALDWFGLRFKDSASSRQKFPESTGEVWIGSDSTATDGRLFVRRVYRDSPSDRAGLNVEDELISLDGYRVTPEIWPDGLGVYQPGQKLELLVARRGKILTLEIELGEKPPHNWQLEEDTEASEAARSRLQRWLTMRTPIG